MPPTYSSRSVTQTIVATGAYTLVFTGNRNRVALNLSGDGTAAANLILEWSTLDNNLGNFLWMDPAGHESLPFRDWGPLIKEPIYARCQLAPMDVLAVETVIVPSERS